MAPQSDQLDERFAGTYRKLFDTIERGGDQCSIDRLQTLLEEKTPNLSLGLEAFGTPSSQSRTKVSNGSTVSVDGKTIKLVQAEKELVIKLADFLNLNELQCVSLWTAFKNQEKPNVGDSMDKDEQLIRSITTFYYEDRLALLGCISSLLRIERVEGHPFSAIASDTIKRIVKDEFLDKILSQLKSHVRSSIPSQFHSSKQLAAVWGRQNLREQRGLLDILFLINLNDSAPKRVLAIVKEFEASSFGMHQAFGYVLDKEDDLLRSQVSHLCVLITIQSLHLLQIRNSGTSKLIESPETIVKLGQVFMFLGTQPEHAAPLLAWSCFLFYLNQLLPDDRALPAAYAGVRKLIDGQFDISPSELLSHRPPTRGVQVAPEPSISPAPQMYRIFAGRAIKLNVFDHFTDVLENPVCNDDEPNSDGYRYTIKNLLSSFLYMTQPCFIPAESYASLVRSTCLLFNNQTDLCIGFWEKDFDENDISSLITTSRGRFPVSFLDLTQLLTSMAGARDGTLASQQPANHVFDYLREAPSMTVMLRDTVNLAVRNSGKEIIVMSEHPIRVTGDHGLVKGVVIPSGMKGSLISAPGQKRIVQWRIDYSCWHLLVGVLAGFIDRSNVLPSVDVEELDKELSGKNIDVVNSILELIYKVLHTNPSLGPRLVDHIDEMCRSAPAPPGEPKLLVLLLCEILSFGSTIVEPAPIRTVTYALQCITSLLPYYRNEIWSYLETAPIFPRPNANIHYPSWLSKSRSTDPACQIQHIVSKVECQNGEYTLLLAFLDIVLALIEDIQYTWWSDDQTTTSQQCKIETLFMCLHYLMLDVFPNYAGWRYKKVSDRFMIGTKVLKIFINVVHYFRDAETTQGLSLHRLRTGVINNFLYDGGVYHVAPLLDTVSNGAWIADKLYHNNRPKEAKRAEKMTELTMVFIKLLLQQRLEAIEKGASVQESTLERLMLERTTSTKGPDFLLRLTKHIYYRHNTMLQILATNIVTLLCRTLSAWSTPPNFVRHLGDKDQAQEIIRTYLSIAQDKFQNERLLASIWQMMALIMETQPSLAILFLECGDYIMPSPKSAVRLLQEQKNNGASSSTVSVTAGSAPASTTTDSAARAAVDLLASWEELSVEKPTVLSSILRFVATFWQTAFDHFLMVQRIRSDSALWDALGKILLNPSIIEPPRHTVFALEDMDRIFDDNEDLSPVMTSESDDSVRRICCLNLSKAFVMRIMAFEIHLTAGQNKGSITDKLPAGLKNQLTKINDVNKLVLLRQSFVKNSFNEKLAANVQQDALALLQLIHSSKTVSELLYTAGSVGFGDDDAPGEPKQYGDSYLFDLRIAEARVHAVVKAMSRIYNVIDGKDIIVTPEVVALRKVKNAATKLLTDICVANHNLSIVDTEILALRSFKAFIETCSCHVGDIIWNNRPSGVRASNLFDFVGGLTQDALSETRKDNVSLTMYSELVGLIRGLTEDWIRANCNTPLDRPVKLQFADKCFSLLETFSELLRRENFTVASSFGGYTSVAYHRPVLESILLPLRSLRESFDPLNDFKDRDSDRLKKCLSNLLDVTCECFQMTMDKITACGASDEECAKDMTVVIGLLIELIHPSYQRSVDKWQVAFEKYKTIPTLLKFVHGGIDLMVTEINSQYNGRDCTSVSPYADDGFYLLLVLSAMPEAAIELVESGLIEMMRNNALTPSLQSGKVDMFLRFGEPGSTSRYVERNPLHIIWCHMLCVLNNILRTLSNNERVLDKVLRSVIGFLQVYGSQVDAAFSLANGANDSLFGLAPSESLSTCLLEEVDRLSMIMYGLAKQSDRVISYATSIFVAYKDYSLALLQRFSYFFTHPTHLQAQLYPINNSEKDLVESVVASQQPSHLSSNEVKTSGLMLVVIEKAVRIDRNILATLIQLTNVEKIVLGPDMDWPYGNTILHPNLRIAMGEPPSFGTLTECANAALGYIKEFQEGKMQESALRDLMSVLEGSLVLLGTQVALWIGKPGIEEEERREIAEDTLVDIVTTLSRVHASLNKLDLQPPLKEQKERAQLQVAQLKRFLSDKYFNT
ncbi:nucleoporin subcomplex protein binding to Pom34-domain-containing protein [Dichotomocladium elegans]|nr:nucleoporin subcomplex protein binding to Pom34-domain-containing protein [Dichotomocladium elegans]